jgi:hypothetical protein
MSNGLRSRCDDVRTTPFCVQGRAGLPGRAFMLVF